MPRGRYKTGEAVIRAKLDERAYLLELGRRIRDRRLELDIPLDVLAAASGVGKPCLSYLERGISSRGARRGFRDPRMLTIVRIAVALDLSPSELMP